MAESKHTPPPWRFDPYSDNIYGSGITVARDVMVDVRRRAHHQFPPTCSNLASIGRNTYQHG